MKAFVYFVRATGICILLVGMFVAGRDIGPGALIALVGALVAFWGFEAMHLTPPPGKDAGRGQE